LHTVKSDLTFNSNFNFKLIAKVEHFGVQKLKKPAPPLKKSEIKLTAHTHITSKGNFVSHNSNQASTQPNTADFLDTREFNS